MNQYARGRRAEWKVRDWLLSEGATFCARTAGSKSPADLIAVFPLTDPGWKGAVFVQVKRAKPSKATARALQKLALETGTKWILVHYDRGIAGLEEFQTPKTPKKKKAR